MAFFYALSFIVSSVIFMLGYLINRVFFGAVATREQIQAKWLYRYFIHMGPIYIKIGQLIATRSDLIPSAWIEKLSKLQDDVPPMTPQTTRKHLLAIMEQPVENLFVEFDYTPIASASIAQVHRAKLLDGREVAVKLVKLGVAQQLKQSLQLISFIVAVLHMVSASARQLGLKHRFKELAALLSKQADLNQELAAQQTVLANFQGHRFVVVPEPYPEWCNSQMLVMQFMRGTPGRDLNRTSFDRRRLARRLQDTIYTMLYMHGFCHGDPPSRKCFLR